MLTKNDLQAIQGLIQQETRKIVQEETAGIIQRELKPIKKDIKSIKKTIDVMIDSFDREDMQSRKRVKRIETHLGLPPQL